MYLLTVFDVPERKTGQAFFEVLQVLVLLEAVCNDILGWKERLKTILSGNGHALPFSALNA